MDTTKLVRRPTPSAWHKEFKETEVSVLSLVKDVSRKYPSGWISYRGPLLDSPEVEIISGGLITATATDPSGNTSAFSTASTMTIGPPGVTLSVSRGNNTVVVSWPSAAAGFQLEATPSPEAFIQWHAITNGISDDGSRKTFAIPVGSAATNQFFRLRR